jgi:hypothetical protein
MVVPALITAIAIAASPYRPLADDKPVTASTVCVKGKNAMGSKAAAASEGVANLPYARGRRFATLDQYLEYLRCTAAPIDLPWWREVRPGVYEHVKRMRGATREVATRAELMKRFGFTG